MNIFDVNKKSDRFSILKVFLGLLCVCMFHFAQANSIAERTKHNSNFALLKIDTCLAERWEYTKIDANTYQPELFCRDIEDPRGLVFRFVYGEVNRARKLEMEKSPRYAPDNIWSVIGQVWTDNFPRKFDPERVHRHSLKGDMAGVELDLLMTLKEWEAENGVVEKPKSKQVPAQEPQRLIVIADVMDSYMGKPATSIPIQTQPTKFKEYKGYTLWRWEKSYKNDAEQIERKCNQEFYVNSEGLIAGWWSNCPDFIFGNLGIVPKSKPIPAAKPREIPADAMSSRASGDSNRSF